MGKQPSPRICLFCKKRDKRPDHQFCSKDCTDAAAKKAPQLLPIPSNHVMYQDVEHAFRDNWKPSIFSPQLLVHPPKIKCIYLITWTAKMRASFDQYRDSVGRRANGPKEVKRFRAEARFCRIGDPGKPAKLCASADCRLCSAIRTGFQSSLDHKRWIAQTTGGQGCRFGAGIYAAPTSSKAYNYCQNQGNGSDQYRALLLTRIVLGNSEHVVWSDTNRTRPSPGFDSVKAKPNFIEPTELVVYNSTCIRPAYLVILEP